MRDDITVRTTLDIDDDVLQAAKELGQGGDVVHVLQDHVTAGKLGMKTGAGFYDWSADRRQVSDNVTTGCCNRGWIYWPMNCRPWTEVFDRSF